MKHVDLDELNDYINKLYLKQEKFPDPKMKPYLEALCASHRVLHEITHQVPTIIELIEDRDFGWRMQDYLCTYLTHLEIHPREALIHLRKFLIEDK